VGGEPDQMANENAAAGGGASRVNRYRLGPRVPLRVALQGFAPNPWASENASRLAAMQRARAKR
jgi:hypothetical protein